jgi:putative FmdB family regulatory protein
MLIIINYMFLEGLMPIYEYRCLDCSKTFEKIVWNSGEKEIVCPECGCINNIRVLSAFSKGSGGVKGVSAPSNCGPSGGGFS